MFSENVRNVLEISIISIAPFTNCFPEKISNIQKCQNASFLVSFSGMITYKLTRNSALICVYIKWLILPKNIFPAEKTCWIKKWSKHTDWGDVS